MADEVVTPAPDPAQIAADNAAATQRASEELGKQIDALAKQISEGTMKVREATDAARPEPVRPVTRTPLSKEDFTKLADEKGVGEALETYTRDVMGPTAMALLAQNARLQKQVLTGSGTVLGKYFSKNEKKVLERAKELGLNDAYFAEKGYDAITRLVAAEDDTFIEERANERAATIIAQKEAAAPKPPPTKPAPGAVTPVEGVYNGPVSATPTPEKTREAAIREVKVERAEVDFMRDHFDMTESDVKTQRYEIEQARKKYGEDGLKRIGGTPIVSFSDLGLPEPRN